MQTNEMTQADTSNGSASDVPQNELADLRRQVEKERQRYNGLKGVENQLRKQIEEMQSQLTSTSTELENFQSESQKQIADLTAQLTNVTQERDTFMTERDTLQADYGKMSQKTELTDLIMGDYPELAGLYANKLIKPFDDEGNRLEGDALKEYLGVLQQSQLTAVQQQQEAEQEAQRLDSQSSRPSVPGAQTTELTVDQLRDRLLSPKKFGLSDAQIQDYNAKYRAKVMEAKE